jgi:hypothetical protein
VGPLVEIDEDVGAAGEDGFKSGLLQDRRAIGGVERVVFSAPSRLVAPLSVPPWPGSMTTPRME